MKPCFPRLMVALDAHECEYGGTRAERELGGFEIPGLTGTKALAGRTFGGWGLSPGWAYPVQRKPTQCFCWSVIEMLVQATQPLAWLRVTGGAPLT